MDIKEVSNTLKAQAVKSGLCEQWTNEWSENETADSLISKYKRGIDFCIERDWPTISNIKTMFDSKELIKNGIYVDCESELQGDIKGTYILNGNSVLSIDSTGYSAITIYVRHNSELNLKAEGNSIIFIRAFDNCSVNVNRVGRSKVVVYRYSCKSVIVCDENVTIKNRM